MKDAGTAPAILRMFK